jgi:hypothetical protein
MDSLLPLSADDRQAITDILLRFFWLVDHGRADETAVLFTNDARLIFGPGSPKPGTVDGAAIPVAMTARAAQTNITTRHVISNLAIAVQKDGTATASSLLTLFRSENETRASLPAAVADLDEVYIRQDGEWRIRQRTVTPVFTRD